MLPFPLNMILTRAGLICVALALVAGIVGAQTLRLSLAKHELAQTRTALADEKAASARLRGAVTASEGLRAAEFGRATNAVSEAEAICLARVAAAGRVGGAIRTLLEKPNALDPKTHCPARGLLGARELRDILQPGR